MQKLTPPDKYDEGIIRTETTKSGPSTSPPTSLDQPAHRDGVTTVEEIEEKHKSHFAYFKTRDFYLVLVLGQVLALCITGTNTFTSLLVGKGTSIPAFQTFFNYALLNIIYSSYTIYKYGFKKYGTLLLRDGWKYIILSFLDVEGNYFVVLAYRYTTILSAQLINFWAIVVVVVISFLFLRVRYHWAQIIGILVCCGGMGLLLASDHITHSNGGTAVNQLKGDLFMLLGSSCYGFDNVLEEFLVSKRPLYEVVGQIGFWGMIINGAQAGIFDRAAFRSATWDGQVGGYLLPLFSSFSITNGVVGRDSFTPIMFRMSSAAFFNISLLTGNFWGVAIGTKVFGLRIHYLYPIAFVLIMAGLIVYFTLTKSVLGDAKKPWLGRNQQLGVSGIGTARRKAENPEAIVNAHAGDSSGFGSEELRSLIGRGGSDGVDDDDDEENSWW
ncbi:hypothetical protein FGG08_005623 [Glutinoglossum americanum]|uniref:DUF914-domain-containing protein n=1 Tax=Glutinoglossum americanum TaxID=1670608 RepID=A0A9P8HXT8_9PEZI|nr:hypothetical protein FGG08_005623 [Glutinoglossum americanum]